MNNIINLVIVFMVIALFFHCVITYINLYLQESKHETNQND